MPNSSPADRAADPSGAAPLTTLRHVLALVRRGEHVIAAVLIAAGMARAIGDHADVPAVVAIGISLTVWYAAGAVAATRSRRRAVAAGWLLGLTAVWVVAVVISPEFVWFAFVIWLLAVPLLGWWPAVGLSTTVFAVVAIAPWVHHGATSYADVFGPLVGGIFALGISRGYMMLIHDATERERLVVSLARAQREMAALHEELALAGRAAGAADERARLARELHDTVAQSLSSIRLLTHAAGATPDPRRTLGQIDGLAADALVDVRRIVAALAPSELENTALASALGRLLGRLADETGVVTELHVDETIGRLPTETEVALLRTAQSGLANVRLHARARRVVVSLIDAGDTVRLDIIDDGCGFDRDEWSRAGDNARDGDNAAAASSFGLRFMRSRLRELGGGLDIESAPGEGCALSAFAPIQAIATVGGAP